MTSRLRNLPVSVQENLATESPTCFSSDSCSGEARNYSATVDEDDGSSTHEIEKEVAQYRQSTTFTVSNSRYQKRWFLADTGAQGTMSSTPMAPECVTAENPEQYIYGIGADRVQVTQRGDAKFNSIAESGVEYRFTLKNVLYAKESKSNILSWGQMSEEGWQAVLNCDGVKDQHFAIDPDGNRHVIVCRKRHFYIQLAVYSHNATVKETYSPKATWYDQTERGTSTVGTEVFMNTTTASLLHRRLGFPSPGKLETMLKTTQVGGYGQVVMPKNPDRRCGCDVCRMTRITKRPVYKQTGLTRQHYEPPQDGEQLTAVVDIAGPFKPGLNGEKFAITLIVHQFCMAYTACIKKKSDSGAAMRQILRVIKDDPSYARFKPAAATHPLSTIFSDQESSFHFHHNMEFRQLSERDIKERTEMVEDYRKVCAEFGITPIVTSSMTSQFNGLVESRHNQIRSTASALLYSAN